MWSRSVSFEGNSDSVTTVMLIVATDHWQYVVIISRWYYVNSIGYSSESMSSSKSLSGQVPVYSADDCCCLVSDSTRCSLRSADVPSCMVPRTLNSYDDRTFAAAGSRLWNSLPVQLCNPDITYLLLRQQLKEHLFGSMNMHSVTSDNRRLTYLLLVSIMDCFLQRICPLQLLHCMAVLYHIDTSVIQ